MAGDHRNRLIHEKSPYLLQHAHNPVDWFPWGEEAFARARAEDKPVLLSIGYSACHWCHVMERESFVDEETAALMNAEFVCIKVDREERPDVDQVYQHAVQLLTQHGGWPLTAFLTPEGKPFFGGTYFPPDERYGRPSFRRVLAALADAWKSRRPDVEENVRQIVGALALMNEISGSAMLSPDILREASAYLTARMDSVHGGFRGAPKFPNATNLSFLLGRAVRGPDEVARNAVLFTLRKMAEGGIYDQLGGGFHRYSTDAQWLVPHFEKMLYDNALLIRLYLDAARLTGDPFLQRIADESIGYVLREMRSPEGGFYCTQDADSEGEEGKFFVWTPKQIEEVVGQGSARIVCAYYGVTVHGNFEHGTSVLHVPRREPEVAAELGISADLLRKAVSDGSRALFEARERRVKPDRDEKILTSWNGLMIGTLSRSPTAAHLDAARTAADFVLTHLYRDGRLLRSYKDGQARHPAILDDYSFFADGLLHLYQATLERRWLEQALALADALIERFWEPEQSAFYLTERGIDLFTRPRSTFDQAVPSGAGVAAQVLLRLAPMVQRDGYEKIALDLLRNHAETMRQNPFGFGSFLDALDGHLHGTRQVVLVGARESPEMARLLAAARSRFIPDLLLAHSDGEELPVALAEILRGKEVRGGKPTAYVCRAQTCSAPLTEPEDLAQALQ
jgi:uncharacterized protein YyaL (SSP411 family)